MIQQNFFYIYGHALYNLSHQLIHSNHFTGTQQSTSPLVGFYSLSAFLVMNGGSLKFKDFRFSKRVGLPPHKRFHSLISPPGSVSILSFPQTKHKQQCLVTWSLHFASCMLPTISFTLRSGTVSSGALYGVPERLWSLATHGILGVLNCCLKLNVS